MLRPTLYPLRQALSAALVDAVTRLAVPVLNAEFARRLPAVQFGSQSVIAGDLSPVREPTICVVKGSEQILMGATGAGQFLSEMATEFRVKTLFADDDGPEDFDIFEGIVADTFRDLFTSANWYYIKPINPATGKEVLPTGSAFSMCHLSGITRMNWPQREADGISYTHGMMLTHSATINYDLRRPNPVGV